MSTHYYDTKRVALLLTPDTLTAFDTLVARNSRTTEVAKANPYMLQEASAVPVWTISYTDNTTDTDRSLEYVLKLPNSPKRMIDRLVLDSGRHQEPSVQLEFRSGLRQGWAASCRGDNKDVLAFRDELDQIIGAAVPRYDWLARAELYQWAYLIGGVTFGSSLPLFLSKVPVEVTRAIALWGFSVILMGVAFQYARKRVFPLFEATIGEGARRHKVRDGWRSWVSTGFASVLFGLVSSALWGAVVATDAKPQPPAITEQSVVTPAVQDAR